MTSTLDWMARRIDEIEFAAKKGERERIIAILEAERDNWEKPGVFNYKVALTTLIERIKE